VTYWAEQLSPVVWSGLSGLWGDGAITSQGDVGAEEVILHSVRARLAADSTLAKLFTADRIEVVEFVSPYDSRDMPRLQVYPGATEDTYQPTKLDELRVRVVVGMKFGLQGDAAATVSPGKAMAAGVLRRCKTILRADANMHLTTPLGPTAHADWLAQNMTMGSVRFSLYLLETGGGTALLELPVDYTVRVDNPSGVIWNILAANP